LQQKPPIRLIVGLGNPGREYEATRHNAGAWWVRQIAAQHCLSWRTERAFFGETARLRLPDGESVWLLLPTAYMNRSGQSVGALAAFYKTSPAAILVAHDELDLLPGTLKLKLGGGHAGHNGLRDIDAQLGTRDYWRLRIGIGHPRTLGLTQNVADFVLSRPNAGDQTLIENSLNKADRALDDLLSAKFSQAAHNLHA
jgi:PTH1 family peptidyl-tRNA hydrolase